MATALNSGGSHTTVIPSTVVQPDNSLFSSEEQVRLSSSVVRLKLNKTEERKKVSWTNDTVDNEHLGKKKSKCCCVYVRPKTFDASSSDESDLECEHCAGHVEKRTPPAQPPASTDPPAAT